MDVEGVVVLLQGAVAEEEALIQEEVSIVYTKPNCSAIMSDWLQVEGLEEEDDFICVCLIIKNLI